MVHRHTADKEFKRCFLPGPRSRDSFKRCPGRIRRCVRICGGYRSDRNARRVAEQLGHTSLTSDDAAKESAPDPRDRGRFGNLEHETGLEPAEALAVASSATAPAHVGNVAGIRENKGFLGHYDCTRMHATPAPKAPCPSQSLRGAVDHAGITPLPLPPFRPPSRSQEDARCRAVNTPIHGLR